MLYHFEALFPDAKDVLILAHYTPRKYRFSTLLDATNATRLSFRECPCKSNMDAPQQGYFAPEPGCASEVQGQVIPRSFQGLTPEISNVAQSEQSLAFNGDLVPAHLAGLGAPLAQCGNAFSPQHTVQPLFQPPTSTFTFGLDNEDGAGQVSSNYSMTPGLGPREILGARSFLGSRQTATANRATSHKNFDDAIRAFLEDQEARLVALAEEHHVTVAYTKSIINSQSNYRSSRKPQLSNALIHAKAQEVNKDRAHGERYTLAMIRKLVAEDPGMRNLTPQEEQAYITILEDYRETKKHGLRANNAAAARDVLLTTSRIVRELDALRDRTGIYTSLFVTRGHINDSVQTMWYGSDNTAVFWEDVFKHSTADVARQYEQWACAQGHNLEERDSLANMRKQVTAHISNGLKMTTGKLTIAMNYMNYETSIIDTYGVKLVGWPNGVPFTSPSNIGVVAEMRKLRDALRSGECHWKKLSKNEREQFTKELESRRANGEQVRKPRKQRSDIGRKRKADTRNKDDERVQRRRTSSTQSTQAAADIDDDEDESEGDT